MPDAGRQPDADDLARARSPGRLVDQLAGGPVGQRDRAAAASKTPAAVRTMPSISVPRRGRLLDAERERLALRARERRPSAFAKAATDATRRSGIISRPAVIVSSSSGVTSGTMLGELGGVGVDGRLAGDQRPERRRQPEDVAARRDVPPANTSGAMKRGVPMPIVPVVLLAELARDAEVDEHDAVLAEDHVLGLDVAVHDLLLVHVLERLAGLAHVLDRVRRAAGPGLPAA